MQQAPLRGWKNIAGFLGQSLSTAQRWARSGMPVKREGRNVVASRQDLNRWLGREAGEPVQIATEDEKDLSEELRRGLREIRKAHRRKR